MPSPTKRKKRGTYKSTLSLLSETWDRTEIVIGGRRCKATQTNNQDDQDINTTVEIVVMATTENKIRQPRTSAPIPISPCGHPQRSSRPLQSRRYRSIYSQTPSQNRCILAATAYERTR